MKKSSARTGKNSLSVFDDGRLAKKFWKYGYVVMPAEETFVRNALDIWLIFGVIYSLYNN